jgi:predicted MFS family arabinose efflux permease
VLCQRAVLAISTEASGRLNAVYMTALFLSGAIGSALGGLTFASGGWPLTVAAGVGVSGAALLLFVFEPRRL